jgi:hypothetical protein
MRATALGTAIVAALACASAQAVSLAARGGGQVLLYPLYSVDRGLQTLVSVANSTDRGKALRVRFAEGRNGREVFNINLYLAPRDSWTAAVIPSGDDPHGGAVLITPDFSCTVPRIIDNPAAPALPNGIRYRAFRNYAYSGTHADFESTSLERTREGTIEVIEMGTIAPGSRTASAIAQRADGSPRDCASLTTAWLDGGYWRADPRADLANPTGGLSGAVTLVDVANGTMWAYDATALDAFRQDPADVPRGAGASVVLHVIPGEPHPNLGDARPDPARGVAAASVAIDGGYARVEYAADRAIDAVSAVLMSDRIDNDFNVDSALGALSEWIVAFPTRSFYVDEEGVGSTPIAPFTTIAGYSEYDDGCASFLVDERDREGFAPSCDPGIYPFDGHLVCPTVVQLCAATQGIPLNDSVGGMALGSDSFLAPALASPLDSSGPRDLGLRTGTLSIDLAAHGATRHRMRPALDGTVLEGMPAIGFLAVEYLNSNARPGLLGNYTGTTAHRFHARCTRADGSACVPQ